MRPEQLFIGTIPVDVLTFQGALDAIAGLVKRREGGFVFTPNVDHVVLAEDNEELRTAYEDASLRLADGMPILWASHLLGRPLPEKVSGSDLVIPLVERAAREGWRVYFLGGAPGVGDLAAHRLKERFPALEIAGVDSPKISLDADDLESRAALARLKAAKADLVLVALGCPKQELWIHRNAAAMQPAVALGVGASLDFIAGVVKRAPRWMQKVGLEWFYRLCQEPGRMWRRYLVRDPQFLGIVMRTLRVSRQLAAGSPARAVLPATLTDTDAERVEVK